MASVDRADYMDNMKVAEIAQTIDKEKAIQRKHFKRQEELGLLCCKPPTPAPQRRALKAVYGLPSHVEDIKANSEQVMSLTFSRQLWGNAVPGYFVRDGPAVASVMKQDYIWDEAELDYLKQQRLLDKVQGPPIRGNYQTQTGSPTGIDGHIKASLYCVFTKASGEAEAACQGAIRQQPTNTAT